MHEACAKKNFNITCLTSDLLSQDSGTTTDIPTRVLFSDSVFPRNPRTCFSPEQSRSCRYISQPRKPRIGTQAVICFKRARERGRE